MKLLHKRYFSIAICDLPLKARITSVLQHSCKHEEVQKIPDS